MIGIVLPVVLMVFCLLTTIGRGLAQSAPQHPLLELADSYRLHGNLDAAITEYYRYIYLHQEDDRLFDIYSKLGVACREAGQQQACIRAFSSALERCQTSEDRTTVRLELATSLLVFDQPLQAQLVLMRVLSRPPQDSAQQAIMHALLGVSSLMTGQWSAAAGHVQQWTGYLPNGTTVAQEMSTLFADTAAIPHRNPTVATVMSAIVPGLGQMYCGEYLDGVNALALNGALLWSVVTQVERQRYLAAVMVGVPLVGRYYMGNLDHAAMYANLFNERGQRAFAARMIEKIASIQSSRMPTASAR
ncbi:MAG: hypothetical protein RL594_296 [Bacteroidota bacterium]|jgi:hypothetical protein